MCTAISYSTKTHYFGRNLDIWFHFNENVTITPRNYPLPFRHSKIRNTHFATIGIATVEDGYPLYYDATNEYGLGMAGLNFPDYAVYHPQVSDKENIAPFEIIPWVLCQCKTVADAKILLKNTNISNTTYSEKYPLTPLHWIIADKSCSIVIEPVESGLNIYENKVGVLTNSPPFDKQMENLTDFMHISSNDTMIYENSEITPSHSLKVCGIGLPGDLSSPSRFLRASFTKLNSVCDGTEQGSIGQFFQILGSVAQQRGCAIVDDLYEITLYSSCCNTEKGIYYYKTYDNSQITAVSLFQTDLNSTELSMYPLRNELSIFHEN